MIGLVRAVRQSSVVVDPNLKLELKFNSQTYTDLAGTVAATTNDYLRAWQSSVNSHLFTQSTDAARPQRVSDGVLFDGGDYMTLANHADFNPLTGDFSLGLWIYPTSAAATVKVMAAKNVSGFSFYLKTDNKLAIAQDNVAELLASTAAVSINTWTYVYASRIGTSLKLYINGTNDGTASNSTNFNSTGMTSIGGGSSGSNPYTGRITDIRFFKGGAEYSANFTPPTRSA